MKCTIRPMAIEEVDWMIDYFLNSSESFLRGMGVDPQLLPDRSEWKQVLETEFAKPLRQKKFYYIVWEWNQRPIGHSNLTKLVFAEAAYMHLHIWQPADRKSGTAGEFVKLSARHYFRQFQLPKLYCEPYALNPAPNRTLPKAGFQLVDSYEAKPGWINFHQPLNLWVLKPTDLD